MSATKSRGRNWTRMEDEALCQAWLHVSQDPIIGTNQRADNLYHRIYEKFMEICASHDMITNTDVRVQKGMKCRWHIINKCVSKFAGCVSQINARQQSGSSPEDNLKKALELYAATEKSPFIMMNCYRILENSPKWKQYRDSKGPTTKRSLGQTSNDSIEEIGGVSSEIIREAARPRGRDFSKRQKISNDVSLELAKSGRLLAAASKAKLDDCFQRTQALKRIANHSIMSMDLTGLNSVAKQYYEIEQRRILDETLKGTASTTDGSIKASISDFDVEEPSEVFHAESSDDELELRMLSDDEFVDDNVHPPKGETNK